MYLPVQGMPWYDDDDGDLEPGVRFVNLFFCKHTSQMERAAVWSTEFGWVDDPHNKRYAIENAWDWHMVSFIAK